ADRQREAVGWIKANPGRFAELTVRRVALYWFPPPELWYPAGESDAFRAVRTASHWAVSLGVAVGLARLSGRDRSAFVAAAGVHRLLLAVLHAYVFLEGSDEGVLNGTVAEEAMQYLATYIQRLTGPDLKRVREDVQTLVGFAKHDKWPKQQVRFLQDFLTDNG